MAGATNHVSCSAEQEILAEKLQIKLLKADLWSAPLLDLF